MAKTNQQIVLDNGTIITAPRITPKMAADLLKSNTANRVMSTDDRDKYARDMETGNFDTTHQGIAFFENGVLADGQTRLSAIVKSGKTIQLLMATNMKKNSHIDGGRKRSIADSLRMAGVSVSNLEVSVLRAMFAGMYFKFAMSTSEAEVLLNKYGSNIQKILSLKPAKSKFKSALIWGTGALALNSGVKFKYLAEFYTVFCSGMAQPKTPEASIIAVRDWFLSNNVTGGAMTKIASHKLQHAIFDYVAQKTNQKTKASVGNIYKLSEMTNA